MRAIVSGMVGTYPVGGVAWDYFQYALGLEQLGFEVHYLEDAATRMYYPRLGTDGEDPSYAVEFLGETLSRLSPTLGQRWCFRGMDATPYGPDADHLADLFAGADLFLNVSGGTLLRDQYMTCPRRVMIESDPGWNHFKNFPKWDSSPGWQGTHGWRAHTHFFTYAQRIGRADCRLPSLGIDWIPTRPPVCIDRWQAQPPGDTWTTVMSWNTYGKPVVHEGVEYGSKEREFVLVEDLPQRVGARLEVASGGTPPVQRWQGKGWSVIDAHTISMTAEDYRHYIQQSRGEFSVAKKVYVATRSGWFSCRSICYLAAGRPVVVQDTGFTEFIPSGEGLIAFGDVAQAAAAIEKIESDYERHSVAARQVAAEFFDARRVISEMLVRIGLG
jgi:hypothetical protein